MNSHHSLSLSSSCSAPNSEHICLHWLRSLGAILGRSPHGVEIKVMCRT